MSWLSNILLAAMVHCTSVLASAASAADYEFGRPATPQEIKLWDIDVRPDGQGELSNNAVVWRATRASPSQTSGTLDNGSMVSWSKVR